jgi:hypothetical protein
LIKKIDHKYQIICVFEYWLVAAVALDVLLAVADAGVGVAARLVLVGASLAAAARFASQGPEVEEVGVAPVALVAADASLALTLALAVALQAARTYEVKTKHISQWNQSKTRVFFIWIWPIIKSYLINDFLIFCTKTGNLKLFRTVLILLHSKFSLWKWLN